MVILRIIASILKFGALIFMFIGILLAIKGVITNEYHPEDFDEDDWP